MFYETFNVTHFLLYDGNSNKKILLCYKMFISLYSMHYVWTVICSPMSWRHRGQIFFVGRATVLASPCHDDSGFQWVPLQQSLGAKSDIWCDFYGHIFDCCVASSWDHFHVMASDVSLFILDTFCRKSVTAMSFVSQRTVNMTFSSWCSLVNIFGASAMKM